MEIAKDSPIYAKRFGLKLKIAPKRLRRFPLMGWVVPEFNNPVLREIAVDPYRIIYTVESREVIVLAIVHASRDLRRALPQMKSGE